MDKTTYGNLPLASRDFKREEEFMSVTHDVICMENGLSVA